MSAGCRFCGETLKTSMVDLGMQPLCESFLTDRQLEQVEPFYPLHVRVCRNCYLAQIGEFVPPQAIFDNYAHLSSYSTAWLNHAGENASMMMIGFDLEPTSNVSGNCEQRRLPPSVLRRQGLRRLGDRGARQRTFSGRRKRIPDHRRVLRQGVGNQPRWYGAARC